MATAEELRKRKLKEIQRGYEKLKDPDYLKKFKISPEQAARQQERFVKAGAEPTLDTEESAPGVAPMSPEIPEMPDQPAGADISGIEDMIKGLYEQRAEQTRAEILQKEKSALRDIASEEASLEPRYREARTQEMTKGQILAKRARDYMESKGYDVGSTVQRGLQIGGATQAATGALTEQEQQTRSDLGQARIDVKGAAASDLQSALAGLSANQLESLINERRRQEDIQRTEGYRQEDLAFKEAALTGEYQGESTLAKQEFDKSMQLLDQKLQAGEIDQQEREYALEQLQDPNSVVNQLNQLKLKSQALGNKKIALQIQDMMTEPPTNPLEEELLRIKVETARQELQDLQDGGAGGAEKMSTQELEKQSTQYSNFIDSIVDTASQEMERRSSGEIYSPAQKVRAATPQIVEYLRNLENSGVDEQVIDYLLSRYGLSLGK